MGGRREGEGEGSRAKEVVRRTRVGRVEAGTVAFFF
jgi:hypothetical protein